VERERAVLFATDGEGRIVSVYRPEEVRVTANV